MKSIKRLSISCSAEREAIKYSENSTKPEVDFEPNRGENVFGMFLPKEALLAETNYGPFHFFLGPIYEQNTSEINFSTCAKMFHFFLGPIYGQNTSEINFSTCATDRRFRSIFIGTRS